MQIYVVWVINGNVCLCCFFFWNTDNWYVAAAHSKCSAKPLIHRLISIESFSVSHSTFLPVPPYWYQLELVTLIRQFVAIIQILHIIRCVLSLEVYHTNRRQRQRPRSLLSCTQLIYFIFIWILFQVNLHISMYFLAF